MSRYPVVAKDRRSLIKAYDTLEVSSTLAQILLKPIYRIAESVVPQLEEEIIELALSFGEFMIEPEYWKGPTQHHRMIHPHEPGKKPHIVLRGRNCFPFDIFERSGRGDINKVPRGESFRTHIPVQLYG